MSFGDLTGLIAPQDPNVSQYVDPNLQAQARNAAMIRLGLGIMSAPYSMRGTAAGIGGAVADASNDYNAAMDNAFRHTMTARELRNNQEDRDFLQQERALQLQGQQRTQQEGAAQTAQRVLTGLNGAQDPNAYLTLVQNSPEFTNALKTLNIQPPYTGAMASPDNLNQFRQQLQAAAGVSAPAAAPIKLGPGDTLVSGADPTKVLAGNSDVVNWVDAGDRHIAVNKYTGQPIPGVAPVMKNLTPDQQQGQFNDPQRQLMAAFDSAGVQLQGNRSPKIMSQRLQALLDANPGVPPAQIVDQVRTGQLDMNGAKRSTAQLSTVLAAANAQATKLEKDFAQLEPLVSQMDATGSPIINRVYAQWKAGAAGDKDTAKFVTYLNEVATEYAKLNSGSTGSAAPAEGEMSKARDVMQNAFSTGGYQGIKEAILQSAQNKRDAYGEGLRAAATRGAAVGAPAATAAPVAAPAASTMPPPRALQQLKEGIPTTFSNGQTWTLRNGNPVKVSG